MTTLGIDRHEGLDIGLEFLSNIGIFIEEGFPVHTNGVLEL